jgi:hypothetical protein
MADTYTVTNDTNGLFVGFFQALTNFINQSALQGVTMELTAPGVSPGAPIQDFELVPSGGNIVAGTAQPAPAQPTITVTSSGGTNNRFAVTNDTPSVLGFFNSLFLALTNFINANYLQGITMELSAPGPSPGAPVQNFAKVFYMVMGTAFPAPAQPTITIT